VHNIEAERTVNAHNGRAAGRTGDAYAAGRTGCALRPSRADDVDEEDVCRGDRSPLGAALTQANT
jgi:hypothetical protein